MRTCMAAMAAAAIVLVLGLAPALAADKPKDLIIGKWEPDKDAGKGFVLEFKKDGKLAISAKGEGKDFNLEGTYKFVTDDSLEVTIEFGGEKETEKLKITKIDKDSLTTVDEKEKEEKFKKVK